MPNRALFMERDVRGCNEEELLSVSLAHGVTRQSDGGDRRDTSSQDKTNYRLVEPGDLVYNKMRMWQGAVGVSRYHGIVSPAYVVLKPRLALNPTYYYYLYKTRDYMDEFNRFSYGLCDDMNSLRYADFRQIYSLYPPPDEQNSIVAFLDRIVAKVDVLQATMELGEPWKSEAYYLENLKAMQTLLQGGYLETMTHLSKCDTKVIDAASIPSPSKNSAVEITDGLVRLFSEFRESLIYGVVMGNIKTCQDMLNG